MKNTKTRQRDSEQHHINSKRKKKISFSSMLEARKLLELGGAMGGEEVKEIFDDDEAIDRKLNDLCAYVHSHLPWRSLKGFLCQKFSLWRIGTGLTGRSVSA